MKLQIAAIIALSAITAKARLHETIAECKARYGAPLEEKAAEKPAEKMLLFQKGIYRMNISFVQDEAVDISVMRSDNRELDFDAVLEILKANGEGSEFEMQVEPSGNKDVKQVSWIRADNKALAIAASNKTHSLLIIRDMQFHKDKEKQEKKAESTDGF